SGPFGLVLISAKSPVQPPISTAAAKTLRMGYLMIVLLSRQPLRPHGHGEADAARCRQLAVLHALAVAGVKGGFRIDGLLLGPDGQVAADQGDTRLREAYEPRERSGQDERDARLAELQVARVNDALFLRKERVVPVVLCQH